MGNIWAYSLAIQAGENLSLPFLLITLVGGRERIKSITTDRCHGNAGQL